MSHVHFEWIVLFQVVLAFLAGGAAGLRFAKLRRDSQKAPRPEPRPQPPVRREPRTGQPEPPGLDAPTVELVAGLLKDFLAARAGSDASVKVDEALERLGVEIIQPGQEVEFDPALHVRAGSVRSEVPGRDQRVAWLVETGLRLGPEGKVLQPAQVFVYDYVGRSEVVPEQRPDLFGGARQGGVVS